MIKKLIAAGVLFLFLFGVSHADQVIMDPSVGGNANKERQQITLINGMLTEIYDGGGAKDCIDDKIKKKVAGVWDCVNEGIGGVSSVAGRTGDVVIITSDMADFDTEVSGNAAVTDNTGKISYPSVDSTKVGFISVTQSVDLDTMESDITEALARELARGKAWNILEDYDLGDTATSGSSIYISLQNSNVGNLVTDGVWWVEVTGSGGSGTPGGSDGDIQYNNDGTFGGFGSYDDGTNTVTLSGGLVANSYNSSSASGTFFADFGNPADNTDTGSWTTDEEGSFWYNKTTNTYRMWDGTAIADMFSSSNTDADAIHDNVASEISAITEKTTPVSADMIIIEDSADSNNKKMVQVGNLPSGSGGCTWSVTDPTFASMSNDTCVYSRASGNTFARPDNGDGWSITSGIFDWLLDLTIDVAGTTGSININDGTDQGDYTASTALPVKDPTTLTATLGDAASVDCTGTEVTGSSPTWSVNMTETRSVDCTFVAVVGGGYVGNNATDTTAVGAAEDVLYYTEFTPASSGAANYMHVSTEWIGTITNVGIWESDGVLIQDCTAIDFTNGAPETQHFGLDAEVILDTGTTYILGITTRDTNWTRVGLNTSGTDMMQIAMPAGDTLASFTSGNATIAVPNISLTITANNLPTTM